MLDSYIYTGQKLRNEQSDLEFLDVLHRKLDLFCYVFISHLHDWLQHTVTDTMHELLRTFNDLRKYN